LVLLYFDSERPHSIIQTKKIPSVYLVRAGASGLPPHPEGEDWPRFRRPETVQTGSKRYQGFQPPELEVEVPRGESQLPWTVGYICMAATSSTRMRQLLKPKKNDIITSGLLVKAASVLQGMMETDTGRSKYVYWNRNTDLHLKYQMFYSWTAIGKQPMPRHRRRP